MNNTATNLDKEYTQEMIEEMVEKIEKLTGTTNWQDIMLEHDLPFEYGAQLFKEMIDDCYPETDVLWLGKRPASDQLDTLSRLDYGMAIEEHFDRELEEGRAYADYQKVQYETQDYEYIIRVFQPHDLENLLTKLTKESNNEQKNTK